MQCYFYVEQPGDEKVKTLAGSEEECRNDEMCEMYEMHEITVTAAATKYRILITASIPLIDSSLIGYTLKQAPIAISAPCRIG